MRNNSYLVIILGVVIFQFGCRESSVIGDDFLEGAAYELALDNTIALEFSTIRFDSLITSRSDRLLVGGQQGTDHGDVSMEAYFLFTLADSEADDYIEAEDFEQNLRYDSITLTIPMDGYTLYLGDETIEETLVLEQLPFELEYPEEVEALYNYSDLSGASEQEGMIMGEASFFLATDRIRDLQIRVSDRLGAALFSRMQNEDDIFSDQELASEWLRGFRLSLRNNPFMFGINQDSLRLTIHTTDNTTTTSSNRDFNFFVESAPYFSKVDHDNIPELLQVVELDDEVASNALEDRAFIIGGLGYATKIDLTDVRSLLLDGEPFIIPEAELKVRWLEQPHETYPDILIARLVDEDLIDLANEQTFELTREEDDEYGRDNFYVMDATNIINFIIDEPFGGQYYLLLTLQDLATTPTPVYLGDQSFSSELNIYTIKNK